MVGGGQSGSVLFVVLVALLLMFLGALFTFRGALTDTSLTDSFSQRQKNTQASDLALQWVLAQIAQLPQNLLLETAANGQPWFLSLSNGAAPIKPTATYWATCITNPTSTATCAAVTLSNGTTGLPNGATQNAWVFVEPTSLAGSYYDIWVHTVDPRTHVAVDTEALYHPSN